MHRTILHEGETRTLGVGAQVIKEQAANTTAFPSMLDVKVLVAPCLVGLVVFTGKLIQKAKENVLKNQWMKFLSLFIIFFTMKN